MRIPTYARQTQADLGLDDEEWTALTEYVETITGALEAEVTAVGGVEEVEEDPPSIDGEKFNPGGWVGLYPGEITVEPSHLDSTEYEQLLAETQRWVEIIGATTIETAFPLSADIMLDRRTQLAAYSKAVIEITETVRSQRLPVEVQRTTHQGLQPTGRPLFELSMREEARGSKQVVSEQVRFSFDTLLNHLFVRFHIELLTEMQPLADEYPYYEAAFGSQISYHQEFVNTGIPSRFIDAAVETDFSSPSVIAKARHEATGEMAEIVDLWEAYQRDIGMELSLADRLNTAVKPISKLYELWCLGMLLDILTDVTDRSPSNPETINRVYRFGGDLNLHYNRSLGPFSRYFSDNLGLSHGPGQPDFALEVGNEIVWVGDAKFKTNVKRADYRRFLSYIVDLLQPERASTILYVAPDALGRRYVRDYPIDHISLRPETDEDSEGELTETFGRLLHEVGAL